jgi:hypothetical protein
MTTGISRKVTTADAPKTITSDEYDFIAPRD